MADANARETVLNILLDMEKSDTFSNVAIGKALRQIQFEDKQKRAFVTRLAEGVIETKIRLDYVINSFSRTGIEKCKPLIRCVLRMGTYQILFMDSVPDSAACNEAVSAVKKHGFASLSGFVNGVLRNIARGKNDIKYPDPDKDKAYALSVEYSMPKWLVEKLLEDYGDTAGVIIPASFAERDTTIRVNTTRTDRAELKRLLEDASIAVREGYYDEKALIISGYDFIKKVPGYRQGLFTVQDESSMCAVRAAGIKRGQTVIDVCAAPGGKTTAACEFLEGEGKVYSMDISADKLSLIEENVERLGFSNVEISAHDATKPLNISADVVISDVPCSGLGIMGRKNDIKYRLTREGINELVQLQRQIADVAAGYVKEGGTLLYSTCTINPDENRGNVDYILCKHRDFKLVEERLFIQGVDKCDGFYYAVLRR